MFLPGDLSGGLNMVSNAKKNGTGTGKHASDPSTGTTRGGSEHAPTSSKTVSPPKDVHPPKSTTANSVKEKATIIEKQENEDLEVDEDVGGGIPERPGNVPRF
jgi:hypothetical protein